MAIYLYIKTHKITGLKYLGMTRKDPFKYNGSGTYWLKHIRKHGKHIDTEIVGIFDNLTDLKKISLEISQRENIVESPKWANLQPEAGDGVAPGWVTIKTGKGIIRIPQNKYDPTIHLHINKNRKHSDEVNRKKVRYGKRPQSTKNKIKAGLLDFYKENKGSAADKTWFYDPINDKESFMFECPEGWVPGRKKFNRRKNEIPVICPHCSVQSYNKSNMTRFHFDNCKNKS